MRGLFHAGGKLIAHCGRGRISTPAFAECGVLDGVSVVRLIDPDRDGIPELYCGYAENETSGYSNSEAVCRFHDGKLETLFDGGMTNSGSDFSPQVRLRGSTTRPILLSAGPLTGCFTILQTGNSIILSNLLNNAVEAAVPLAGEKDVHIEAVSKNGFLLLCVTNPTGNTP